MQPPGVQGPTQAEALLPSQHRPDPSARKIRQGDKAT